MNNSCDRKYLESVKPGLYKLTNDFDNSQCDSGYNIKKYSFDPDIESELKTLNYKIDNTGHSSFKQSKNPFNYSKSSNNKYCGTQYNCELNINRKSCSPSYNTSRYHFIDTNITGNIHSNNYIGENTRLRKYSSHKQSVTLL